MEKFIIFVPMVSLVATRLYTYNTIFTSVNMLLPCSTKFLWDKFPQTLYIYISIATREPDSGTICPAMVYIMGIYTV